MFAKFAERVTRQLENDSIIDSDKYELYKYGFQQGLILMLNFMTSLVISIVFGKFIEGLLLLAAYMPLRSYAGGHHSDSSERCYVISSLIMVIWMSVLKFTIVSTGCCVILLVTGAGICLLLAPVESNSKPLDTCERRVYRRKSHIILAVEVCLWLLFMFVFKKLEGVIPLAVFTESIMLILGKLKNKSQ